jgi:hypothetical protein
VTADFSPPRYATPNVGCFRPLRLVLGVGLDSCSAAVCDVENTMRYGRLSDAMYSSKIQHVAEDLKDTKPPEDTTQNQSDFSISFHSTRSASSPTATHLSTLPSIEICEKNWVDITPAWL